MRTAAKFGLAILAVLGGVAGFGAYLGYFGGSTYTQIAATGAPSPARAHLAAVIFSGDMGFRIGMGPRIAKRLAADGIPVIGVNSLAFFRHQRTPAEIKALVSDATRRALTFGHADKVILIGQSFGGDALQVGLTGMAAALRAKVQMVALVVPTDTVFYRASPSELLNWDKPDALALPTARQLNWLPVTCIYGREETESLCPLLHQANVRVVALPGGHPLHGDVDAVHAVLSRAIDASARGLANITKD